MVKFVPIFLFILFSLFCFTGSVFASSTDGTVSGYAWSDKIGWVNFGTTNGNIHVTNSAITGYAWNENTGRINLNPTNSGVANDGSGALSGKAWAEGTGWINFSGVTISSSGVFSGTATGDNSVNIYFSCANCNVSTDWRSGGSTTGSTGGGGPAILPNPPKPPFWILLNSGSSYTNKLDVKAQSYAVNTEQIKKISLSNLSDFKNAYQEVYEQEKNWTLSQGDGLKTVYARFYSNTGEWSEPVSASIILDTIAPEIKITSAKDKYNSDEDVVLGGTTEPNANVTVLIDGQYGGFSADDKGSWFVTLGKLEIGNHRLELTSIDLAGNASKTITVDFIVEKGNATLAPALNPILRQLEEAFNPIISKFLNIAKKPLPKPIVKIPKEAQAAFSINWRLLPEKPIARFVLAPLPKDVALLAQKFPEVGKTFQEVGITKITDVQKIQNSNLSLPGLTETVGLAPTNVPAGKLSLVKGIPIAQLSQTAKSKIPSGIVFSKAGGGLVDFNVALSVNNKGKTEQRINTLVNNPLQLVVKPDAPVKKVRGYIIFKSRKPAGQPSISVPLKDLAISSVLANPTIISPAALSAIIPVEGVAPGSRHGGTESSNASLGEVGSLETRLVLAEFEYVDSGDGIYTATIQTPVVDGEYEIITVMEYADEKAVSKEIKLITVVDPEGYIYEKNGDKETRIAGAVASLYWLNPDSKQYELWPAKNYQQENPQTTDVRGTYSFLVPDGYYYIKVDAPGYLSYDGKPFQVTEGSGIHINVELKTKFWFLNMLDWKTLLLIAVVLLLVYNFYRDRRRERQPAMAN